MSNESGNGKYAPRPGNIPGVAVNLGGVDLVLAPLGLRLMREFQEKGKEIQKPEVTSEQAYDFNAEVILASLQRNYPDMTREDLDALLDSANVKEAFHAVFEQSGFKRVKPGEIPPGG